MFRSARNRLRPVWITFVWNCLPCFSNTKIGSVTSFSILFNFQGPVRRSLSGWRLDYFTTEAVFCQALFWEAFEVIRTWSASYISVSTGVFQRLLVLFKGFLLSFQKSFFCLSAWRSSIIPHTGTVVNTFWHLFSNFFAERVGAKLQPQRTLSGIAQRLRGFSPILLHYIGRANPNRV